MTYASSVLTKELQRAVKNRANAQKQSQTQPLPARMDYEVSPQAESYLRALKEYREQAQQVRVGRY